MLISLTINPLPFKKLDSAFLKTKSKCFIFARILRKYPSISVLTYVTIGSNTKNICLLKNL